MPGGKRFVLSKIKTINNVLNAPAIALSNGLSRALSISLLDSNANASKATDVSVIITTTVNTIMTATTTANGIATANKML